MLLFVLGKKERGWYMLSGKSCTSRKSKAVPWYPQWRIVGRGVEDGGLSYGYGQKKVAGTGPSSEGLCHRVNTRIRISVMVEMSESHCGARRPEQLIQRFKCIPCQGGSGHLLDLLCVRENKKRSPVVEGRIICCIDTNAYVYIFSFFVQHIEVETSFHPVVALHAWFSSPFLLLLPVCCMCHLGA